MRTAYLKIEPFLPHNWLDLPGLRRVFIALFYATLAVGLYAAVQWGLTFFTPPEQLALNSAPLRRLYGLATLQAALACVGFSLPVCGLKALSDILRAVSR